MTARPRSRHNTEQIRFMISSMFDLTEFVQLNLDRPIRWLDDLSLTFDPTIELHPFKSTHIATCSFVNQQSLSFSSITNLKLYVLACPMYVNGQFEI